MHYLVKTKITNLHSLFTCILFFIISTSNMILVTNFLSEINVSKINYYIKKIIVCISFYNIFRHILLNYGTKIIFPFTSMKSTDITIHLLSVIFIKTIIKSYLLFLFFNFGMGYLIFVQYINYDTVFIIQRRTKYSLQICTDQQRDNTCTVFLCLNLCLFDKISTAYILFRSMVFHISTSIFFINGP